MLTLHYLELEGSHRLKTIQLVSLNIPLNYVMPLPYRKKMVYQLSLWVRLIRLECGKLVRECAQYGQLVTWVRYAPSLLVCMWL